MKIAFQACCMTSNLPQCNFSDSHIMLIYNAALYAQTCLWMDLDKAEGIDRVMRIYASIHMVRTICLQYNMVNWLL